LIISVGGMAVASNMAFKMRYALYLQTHRPRAKETIDQSTLQPPLLTYALVSQIGLPNVTTRIFQVNPRLAHRRRASVVLPVAPY